MNVVGRISEVDEGLTVRPALYNNATRLRVERKQRAVQITGRIHNSTNPPPHSSSVMDVRTETIEVLARVKVGRATHKRRTHRKRFVEMSSKFNESNFSFDY